MICFVCALLCEAKPLIRHYGLKKRGSRTLFPIYEGEGVRLTISGIGKVKAAAATAYLGQEISERVVWINVGLGGHSSLEVGRGVWADCIEEASTGRRFYPSFVLKERMEREAVFTVDRPDLTYENGGVVEMEASGFYEIASRLSPVELVHVYKVISDNSQATFDKKQVTNLMSEHCEYINSVARELKKLLVEIDGIECEEFFQKYLSKYHFTETEKHQLRALLQRWMVCDPEKVSLINGSSAKEVLKKIENDLR